MNVLNIHKRTLNQPKSKVAEILATLATKNDRIWPTEQWPAMKFKNGLTIGSEGGHGPIRYSIEQYNPSELIQFRFSKPDGFNGIHKFELTALTEEKTEIKHTIAMTTSGKGSLIWLLGVRALHDALIEDGLDKLENNFLEHQKSSKWSFWVRFLRKQLAKRQSR